MEKLWQEIVDILPISPEMIPLAVAFATIVIGALGILVLGLSSAKIKTFSAGEKGKSHKHCRRPRDRFF